MITYEVNLTIQNEIYQDYYNWLTHHIKLMMNHKGFIAYNMVVDTETKSDSKNLTVYYSLDNIDSLNDYLDNHSKEMRDDGIKKFGDKFSANRRILMTDQCFGTEKFVEKMTENKL